MRILNFQFSFLLDDAHAACAYYQQAARQHQHVHLRRHGTGAGEEVQHLSAEGRRHDLGHADGAVEKAEVGAHVASAQRVGQDGEGQGQHRRPCAAYQQEGYEQQVLVMHEVGGDEARAAQHEAERVGQLAVLEHGEHHRPNDRPDGLYREEDAHPVARILVLLRLRVQHKTCHTVLHHLHRGRAEGIGSHRAVRIGPHEHEGRPAEELHEAHRPEGFRRTRQEAEDVDLLRLLLLRDAVVFGIELRRIFLHLHGGVDDAEDEDGRADVEGVDDRVGYHSLGGDVADAEGGEGEGEEVARQASGVAQEALYGIGQAFLFLIDHVAHHHLEGLHRHVDAGVQQHQGYQSEHHRRTHRHAEAAGVGQHAHHEHGHRCSHEEVRYAPPEAAPRAVAEHADEGLHDDAHQRGQYPEVTQAVRIGAQRGENAADIGALQGVGYLYAEEAEADVPQLPETFIGYFFHWF